MKKVKLEQRVIFYYHPVNKMNVLSAINLLRKQYDAKKIVFHLGERSHTCWVTITFREISIVDNVVKSLTFEMDRKRPELDVVGIMSRIKTAASKVGKKEDGRIQTFY